MRFYRAPLAARLIFRDALFRMPGNERVLCLSFDDGPSQGSTEKILGILAGRSIRALFFCTGTNAEANPALMDRVRDEGHIIGNHGFFHLDGFRTSLNKYCNNAVEADPLTSSSIFRPPYGRLTLKQYNYLKKRYKIVMWDIMPYDFDPLLSPARSHQFLKAGIRPGSIIVLHDTTVSSAHFYLSEFINHALHEGYRFDIPEGLIR